VKHYSLIEITLKAIELGAILTDDNRETFVFACKANEEIFKVWLELYKEERCQENINTQENR
jgi:hypothetical protein